MSKKRNFFQERDNVEFAEGGAVRVPDENLQVAVEEEGQDLQRAEVVETPEPENDANNTEDTDNIDDGLKSRHVGGPDYVYQGNF